MQHQERRTRHDLAVPQQRARRRREVHHRSRHQEGADRVTPKQRLDARGFLAAQQGLTIFHTLLIDLSRN
jgi:hypothetical protein